MALLLCKYDEQPIAHMLRKLCTFEREEIVDVTDKKITIADVADHLGISKTTVSRAISGKAESVKKPEEEYRST